MRVVAAACLLGLGGVLAGCGSGDPAPAAAPPGVHEAARATEAFALVSGGAAERPVVHVSPGGRALVPLRIANAADRARRFRLGVAGAAAGWAGVPAAVRTAPRASRPVHLTLRVPVDARTGVAPIVVWAEPAAPPSGGAVDVVYRSAVRVRVDVEAGR